MGTTGARCRVVDGPIIAHRGASAGALENTLAALEHAAHLGARSIELDGQRTVGTEAAVIHDPTVECITDVVGPRTRAAP